MKKTFAIGAIATMLLAACAGHATPEPSRHHGRHHGHHHHAHDHHSGQPHHHAHEHQQFECRNGMTVTVLRHGEERITVSTNTDTGRATLQIAASGSGERYVSNQGLYGKNTEWHEKNGEAVFTFTDPYNNQVETQCRVK